MTGSSSGSAEASDRADEAGTGRPSNEAGTGGPSKEPAASQPNAATPGPRAGTAKSKLLDFVKAQIAPYELGIELKSLTTGWDDGRVYAALVTHSSQIRSKS